MANNNSIQSAKLEQQADRNLAEAAGKKSQAADALKKSASLDKRAAQS